MTEIEPSIVKYWKNNEWKTVKRVFKTEEEITKWYKHNRWRIEGLAVVIPLKDDYKHLLNL
jgi:hypothetical protein